MAIFKNLTKVPKNTFPKDMVIEETKKKKWWRHHESSIMKISLLSRIMERKAKMFFLVGRIYFNDGLYQIKFGRCSWVF